MPSKFLKEARVGVNGCVGEDSEILQSDRVSCRLKVVDEINELCVDV